MTKNSLLAALILAAPAICAASPDDYGMLFDGRGKASLPSSASVFIAPPTAKPVRVGGSDWYAADPNEAADDRNPSAPEKTRFWEGLQKSVMDACRGVDLSVDQEPLVGGVLRVGGRLSRSMMRYADGRLAVLDEFSPKVGIGYTPTLWSGDPGLAAQLYVGADMTGQSLIVRRAPKGVSSCKQLLKLANPLSVKTVLPAKAKRLHDMEEGELWKMGLAFKFGFQPAVTAGGQYVAVILYWGALHENRENLSLYRMAPDKLRLRLRLDRADISTKGGSVVGTVTAGQLGLQVADDFLANALGSTVSGVLDKVINRAIAHEISSYLRAAVDVSEHKRTGEQTVLEFILDPNDQTQMEAVTRLMKGDFLSLKALARLVHPKDGPQVVDERGRLETWKGDKAAEIGKEPTFAGIDKYKKDMKRFHFKLPIIWDHQTTWNKSDERITLLDKSGSKINVYETEKRGSNKFIEIPILGNLTAHDKWRSAQTFTSRDKDGKAQTPAFMYVQQEGFHHENAASARDMARGADQIMRLAGTHGNGENAGTKLPVDELFPQPAPAERDHLRERDQSPSEPGYRGAVTALTVVLNQKAVQDILRASAAEVVKCYVNALDDAEKKIMTDVLALPDTKLSRDGSLKYKLAPMTKSMDKPNVDSLQASIASMASTAAKIVKDLAEAAAAKTPEEQAQAFSRVMAGAGKSGLAYENILKVLVQLVDPLDISAEFYARTDKHIKGEKDVNVRYILNDRKVADDKLLGQMLDARKRFIEPTKLTD